MNEPNAVYNLAKPDSLPVRAATAMRRRLYALFLNNLSVDEPHSILDVGATSDRTFESSNYLEAWYPYKWRITAAGIDDACWLESEYPGVRFVKASGCALPFADQSFDFVHSSAVIEHVGSFLNQEAFATELARVARKGFFLTTPNRWHPIEFHTLLPILHWLPKRFHRAALRRLGHKTHAKEEVLNLMSAAELRVIGIALGGFDIRVDYTWFLGWPSNLIMWGLRRSA